MGDGIFLGGVFFHSRYFLGSVFFFFFAVDKNTVRFSVKYSSLLLQLWSFNRWRILNFHIYIYVYIFIRMCVFCGIKKMLEAVVVLL